MEFLAPPTLEEVPPEEVSSAAGAMTPQQCTAVVKKGRADQDYVVRFQGLSRPNGEKFNAFGVFDGHGNTKGVDGCIDAIRKMDPSKLTTLFMAPNPCIALYEACSGFPHGATMNLFLIFKDRIENYNIGDSQGKVLMLEGSNWILQATSVMHSPENEAERVRLAGRVVYKDSFPDMTNITGPAQILSSHPSKYVEFLGSSVLIAVTQALGHNGVTGCQPGFFSVPIVPGNRYRVICATDGPWDVLGDFDHNVLCTESAQGIIDLVLRRWAQKWTVTFSGVYAAHAPQSYTFPEDARDDCAICVYDI